MGIGITQIMSMRMPNIMVSRISVVVHMAEEEKGNDEIIEEKIQLEESEQVFKYLSGFYDGLATISDINLRERTMLLRLNLLAQFRSELKLDNAFISELRDTFLKYSISKNRKGRQESFDAIKGSAINQDRQGWFRRKKK